MAKKLYLLFILSVFLLILIINPFITNRTDGKEILYVGGTGDGNFTNIQAAINSSLEGDIIYVYNGTYNEDLLINKSIDLMGEDRNNTFFNATGKNCCIFIDCRNISISGFTIKNSSIGVYVYSSKYNKNISICNMTFYNNTNGILLDSSSSNMYIFSNIFKNNSECLRLYNSSNNLIISNYFQENEDCILFYDTSNKNLIKNNKFLFFSSGINLIRWSNNNTILSNNISNGDDGISLNLCNNIKIEDNVIFNNSDKGIFIKDSKNIEIINNSIVKNGYRGLYIDNVEDYNMTEIRENNIFMDNYQDIQVKSKPPVIKIPSVEMILIIIFVIISMIVFFLKIKLDKNN